MPWYLSPYIVAIAVSWAIAHIIKFAIAHAKGKVLDFTHQLFISGGMPSSHAATSLSVWTVLVLQQGLQSPLVGVTTLLVLIVCYDAVKVRRSSGEQGIAIQQVIKKTGVDVTLPRAAQGHTPLEIFVGSLLGVLVGVVVFFATK